MQAPLYVRGEVVSVRARVEAKPALVRRLVAVATHMQGVHDFVQEVDPAVDAAVGQVVLRGRVHLRAIRQSTRSKFYPFIFHFSRVLTQAPSFVCCLLLLLLFSPAPRRPLGRSRLRPSPLGAVCQHVRICGALVSLSYCEIQGSVAFRRGGGGVLGGMRGGVVGRRGQEGRVGRSTVRHRVALLMIRNRGHHRTQMVGVITKAPRAAEITEGPRDPGGGRHLIFGPEPKPVGLGGQIR